MTRTPHYPIIWLILLNDSSVSTDRAPRNGNAGRKMRRISFCLRKVNQVRVILRATAPDLYIPRFNELGDVIDEL
jgi:hypothetical protein